LGHRDPAVRAEVPTGESLKANACGEDMEKIKIEQHTFMGSLWITAWLFTIGFLHLGFWKGVVAIVLWPYYLGVHFSTLVH
jgi:uncharacterized membrane protein